MRIDHKDFQLIFFRDGAEEIGRLIDEGSISPHTIRRAMGAIESKEDPPCEGRDSPIAQLKEVLFSRGMLSPSVVRPKAGDVRSYKVQQYGKKNGDGDGSLFVRVPVSHLGVSYGDEVRASFFVGTIKIEPREV